MAEILNHIATSELKRSFMDIAWFHANFGILEPPVTGNMKYMSFVVTITNQIYTKL